MKLTKHKTQKGYQEPLEVHYRLPVPVKTQSAPVQTQVPKVPMQYNPHVQNTAATTYRGGCGGCGKATRIPTAEEIAAHEKRIMQMQQAQFQNAVSKGCCGG